jgi:hypothetical protein
MPVIRSNPQRKKEATSTRLPAVQAARQEKEIEEKTGAFLPIARESNLENGLAWDIPSMLSGVDIAESPHEGVVGSKPQGSLSGSGAFESGQSDATVANSYVTATSVILVTLTSNPGPVVVQYITLQPQAGFTVHLTAPTVTHTTFNYIVLLGELF